MNRHQMPEEPEQRDFDLRNATDCVDILQGLFSAALALTTGNARTRIRISDRWTDFSAGDYPSLVRLYMTTRNQCAASGADVSSLPDLSTSVQRGGPIYTRLGHPRP